MSQPFSEAQDLMSRNLITVGLEDLIRKAYQLMQESNIRHLPVRSEQGDVIGILSDRDVRRAMIPAKGAALFDEEPEFYDDALVRDYMSWPVTSVQESASVAEVTRTLLDQKISAVLVVGGHGRIKGIVTTEDLLRAFLDDIEGDPSRGFLTIESFFHKAGASNSFNG